MTNEQAEDLAGETGPADELRRYRERRIVPAGMSYERALEIAIAVMDQSAESVDWFAADVIYRTPRLY